VRGSSSRSRHGAEHGNASVCARPHCCCHDCMPVHCASSMAGLTAYLLTGKPAAQWHGTLPGSVQTRPATGRGWNHNCTGACGQPHVSMNTVTVLGLLSAGRSTSLPDV
jgi:hypothetical protein